MHITIECLTGSLAGKVLAFDQEEISLGRGEQKEKDIDFADIDIGVSRNHGLIAIRAGRVVFTDASRGGTLVRGQRVNNDSVELRSGDELQLGGPSGPRLRVRYRALTQIVEPGRMHTQMPDPPETLIDLPPAPLPPPRPVAAPLPPVAAAMPADATAIQPPSAPPLPQITAQPAPSPNGTAPLPLPPVSTPPPPSQQQTMLQMPPAPSPSAPTVPPPPRPAVVPAPSAQAPYVPPVPPMGGETFFQQTVDPDATVYHPQAPSAPPVPEETFFQSFAAPSAPSARPAPAAPNANSYIPPEQQTMLQTPAPVIDSNPTLLQEPAQFPWLLVTLFALGVLALLAVIWVFLLRQSVAFFIPVPLVLLLGLGWFFYQSRKAAG
ncbi:FHA domain-containing protein [Gloeobacter violaceus]|uniref:Glr0432 protein n=1 Tax=Gloeobacter violaceus (strain ATCC 29082 / PCC 7421) TaxID=251221 RepID=Q7NNH9_GLOVI|nr:FHA domain-containing protein [Gloeobacter violaceus]BAC88373.1 glr0432 [Gloeobacter violaceus PCC 7421]